MAIDDMGARAPAGSGSATREVAGRGAEAAGRAASDVKDTAAVQARRVTREASTQARNVAAQVRDRVGQQARTQNDNLVGGIRRMADELDQMRGERSDSPAATVVSRVADSGRRLADQLAAKGPDGVLREVQDFARRRPGAFLAAALLAGFVVGRLGKGVMNADRDAGKPTTDAFTSGARFAGDPGYSADPASTYPATASYPASGSTASYPTSGSTASYPTSGSTEYAATGTGTPVPVAEPGTYTEPGTYAEPGDERRPDYESRPR